MRDPDLSRTSPVTLSFSFRSLPKLFVLVGLALAASACGSDDDKNPCEKTAEAICSAACGCGGATGCAVGDASGAITFDNKAGCLALYSFGCSQPADSIDDAPCQAALATPVCVQSPDGRALSLPVACQ
jgi:hypothetical protein